MTKISLSKLLLSSQRQNFDDINTMRKSNAWAVYGENRKKRVLTTLYAKLCISKNLHPDGLIISPNNVRYIYLFIPKHEAPMFPIF